MAVRRSVLVYDLLRSEQSCDGFSQKQIVTHISSNYDIAANKSLQKDVAVALRRGLDFGILSKKGNKFRFEVNVHQTRNLKRNIARRNTARRNKRSSSKKKARSTATKGRQQRRRQRQNPAATRGRTRKQSGSVPRPKLPKPPSWSPKRRYLAEEPIPKVKHS